MPVHGIPATPGDLYPPATREPTEATEQNADYASLVAGSSYRAGGRRLPSSGRFMTAGGDVGTLPVAGWSTNLRAAARGSSSYLTPCPRGQVVTPVAGCLDATEGRLRSMDTEPELYDAKADFTSIYNEADPRAYFATLGALSYEIPRHGRLVFERLLDVMGGRDGKTVLDVCCSYGINAALLNHKIDLEELDRHYASVGAVDASVLEEIDRDWFAARRRADAVRTVGLDVAERAVAALR
jgi:hypothetical protein